MTGTHVNLRKAQYFEQARRAEELMAEYRRRLEAEGLIEGVIEPDSLLVKPGPRADEIWRTSRMPH